ncbi:16S rRNA pseudouridine516 synthase [Alkalibacillus filiformis]|uniref:Pseudouridine synthase n=1 Tax=Alkalibacillus filiformis TaxID=200990 RepID=A0ABU0DS78_9BACI|nr:pseudouridine synthase [Alkalibacillus filiformis]MDQ0351304.1 16S rRNA pseudouridine516 synthase [Alkalibacillus filiformis]
MRLDKLLANEDFGSRKDVKKLIKKGSVQIDGEVIKDVSHHVDPTQSEVVVNGHVIDYREFVYIMLNKPKGVISATEDSRHKCVTDLLDPFYDKFNLFPVGRLDKDTVGLLLLTNDGELAHHLTSPRKKVDKIYEATINGIVTEEDVQAFKEGVTLDDGYFTKPAQLEVSETTDEHSWVIVKISEGKFHQIKRMFQARGHEVRFLKRRQMGSLSLDEQLPLGEYRELTERELDQLKA